MDYKNDFPILKIKDIVYLDSGATTQKPIQVINAVDEFYKNRLNNKMYDIVKLQTKADGFGGVYYQLSSRVSYAFETNKMKEGDNNGVSDI